MHISTRTRTNIIITHTHTHTHTHTTRKSKSCSQKVRNLIDDSRTPQVNESRFHEPCIQISDMHTQRAWARAARKRCRALYWQQARYSFLCAKSGKEIRQLTGWHRLLRFFLRLQAAAWFRLVLATSSLLISRSCLISPNQAAAWSLKKNLKSLCHPICSWLYLFDTTLRCLIHMCVGRIVVCWQSFRNNLAFLCHPICSWL